MQNIRKDIKKNDEVIITAGKDKGRRGKVLKIIRDKNRVVIEGVNLVKKHMKPNPQKGTEGGIVEKEASVDLSNIALWDPVAKKASRVGFRTLEDGTKVRFYKASGEVVDI